MGYPQQNALSSFPIDSYPYYEVYPFPPNWLSMQAYGRESRLLQYLIYGNAGNYRGGIGDGAPGGGARSGISWAGRTTADWSWEGGVLTMDDSGHAEYEPVTWGTPMRPGQDVPQWCANKALDDPDSSDEYTKVDAGTAFYQGNGHPIGRNWRYFATENGVPAASNTWMAGNNLAPIADPYYTNPVYVDPVTTVPWNKEWAWFCFQRLSGVDAAWVGSPANAYANASQLNNTQIAATTISSVTSDSNPPSSNPWMPAKTVAVPSKSFVAHEPALFYRAGWLPIRGLLTNPEAPTYMGLQNLDPDQWNSGAGYHPWAPNGWNNNDATIYGLYIRNPASDDGARLWNVAQASGYPHNSQPMATYEMRANYRDRAIDLWQSVMPGNSNLAQLEKNPDNTQYANPFNAGIPGESNGTQNNQYYGSLVEESMGGTMVDCCKYEYPPMELDRFQFITPSQLSAADWPIHPAQVEALSFLAHAAMMVTGYSAPFAQEMPQLGSTRQDLVKLSWESLNWTYGITPEEEYANEHAGAANPPYPQLPLMSANVNSNVLARQDGYLPAPVPGFTPVGSGGQGIVKDALVCAADVINPWSALAPTGNQIKQIPNNGATWYIDVCNPTAYDFVVYPGDEIVLEPSYYQYFYRKDTPTPSGEFQQLVGRRRPARRHALPGHELGDIQLLLGLRHRCEHQLPELELQAPDVPRGRSRADHAQQLGLRPAQQVPGNGCGAWCMYNNELRRRPRAEQFAILAHAFSRHPRRGPSRRRPEMGGRLHGLSPASAVFGAGRAGRMGVPSAWPSAHHAHLRQRAAGHAALAQRADPRIPRMASGRARQTGLRRWQCRGRHDQHRGSLLRQPDAWRQLRTWGGQRREIILPVSSAQPSRLCRSHLAPRWRADPARLQRLGPRLRAQGLRDVHAVGRRLCRGEPQRLRRAAHGEPPMLHGPAAGHVRHLLRSGEWRRHGQRHPQIPLGHPDLRWLGGRRAGEAQRILLPLDGADQQRANHLVLQ